jgi:hypothetical protein
MSEPENHTLHLLRELRDDVQKIDRKIDALDRKVDAYHDAMRERVDSITQILAGEIAASRYINGGVDRRLADIERRLPGTEPSR